ncbi:hypothetical protein ON021_08910, partial [Microcoleus sp. HI-ES]|nr:hypothetical protein [Microcoleus sp. HI-ES]
CVEAEPLDMGSQAEPWNQLMGSQAEPWNQLKTRVFPASVVLRKQPESFLRGNKLQKALPPVTF